MLVAINVAVIMLYSGIHIVDNAVLLIKPTVDIDYVLI